MLESHLSYPMLGYFRSHHQNQSWLTAITAVIDAAAITILCADEDLMRQAELTFAMGRHVLSDVAAIFRTGKDESGPDRLPAAQFKRLRDSLAESHLAIHPDWLDHGNENWRGTENERKSPRGSVSDPFRK